MNELDVFREVFTIEDISQLLGPSPFPFWSYKSGSTLTKPAKVARKGKNKRARKSRRKNKK